MSHTQHRLGGICALSWLTAATIAASMGGIEGVATGIAVLIAIPAAWLMLEAFNTRN